MKKRYSQALLLLLCLALCLTAAGCAKKEESVTRVVLDWTPNTNHTGLYVALEKGWYAEEGLTVEIMQPPAETALGLVGAGNAEVCVSHQEGLGPAIASPNPVPVTAIAALVQHNTSGILSLKETGIETPKDLCGKKFATWGTPLVDETIRQLVEGDGGDFEAVEMVFDEATDAISALQTRIDAIWIYYAWDGIAAQLAGVESSYLDFGQTDPVFDFYTPLLVGRDSWLESNPEDVKAFLRATTRGYEFAIENPDEAAQILLKHAPELSEDLVVESQRWLAGQYQAEASRWGEFDPSRWSGFYSWMYEKGLLERDLGAEGFTNEYLPG